MKYNHPIPEFNQNARSFDKIFPTLENVEITLKYWDKDSSKYEYPEYSKFNICGGRSYIECPTDYCEGKIYVGDHIQNIVNNKLDTFGPFSSNCGKQRVKNGKSIGSCRIESFEVTIKPIFKNESP